MTVRLAVVLVALAGCTGDGTKPTETADTGGDTGADTGGDDTDLDTATRTDTGADTGTDTGAGGDTGLDDACGADVASVPIAVCAETTAPPAAGPTTSWYGFPFEFSGAGTVTEVGGALAVTPGSAALEGFELCDADFEQQVRLLDDLGETWTFGWDVDGAADAGSADAIAVGAVLGFYGVWVFETYSSAAALLVSDDLGPLFLFEQTERLTDEQRGGVGVSIDTTDTCVVDAEGAEHYLVEFSWTDGSAQLRSSQEVTIPLPDRDLDLILGGAWEYLYCTDGCALIEWAAWAEAP
jgi:hypothetical protein